MTRLVIGLVLVVVGLPFFVRGLVFTRRPEHPATLRAKKRNLRLGLDTDMVRWGKRIRRFGFLLMVAGGALAAFGASNLD
ncbi:MAG: hypothetical protein HYV07_18380 [Deltaproteobacteria bacterium]|nr:hypothetical protein [Deltaproteobacteria bacterium]